MPSATGSIPGEGRLIFDPPVGGGRVLLEEERLWRIAAPAQSNNQSRLKLARKPLERAAKSACGKQCLGRLREHRRPAGGGQRNRP
jgi:hypothetical protein